MIHELNPMVYHNEYRPEEAEENSVIMYFEADCLMLREEKGSAYPRLSDLKDMKQYDEEGKALTYLFSIDDVSYYLAPEKPVLKDELEECFSMEKIFSFRTSQNLKHERFALVTAAQLYRWYSANRFCGKCGKPMKQDPKERMMRCECGHMVFPKISPCVIVALTDGDRLLRTKYSGREYTRYALIAGFAEIGEPLEETVRREVMEEVGLKVKNIRYYKSQPWSLTDTLLMGFFCDLDGDDKITLDTDELSVGEWATREEVTSVCEDNALTNEMMVVFARGLEPKADEVYKAPHYSELI